MYFNGALYLLVSVAFLLKAAGHAAATSDYNLGIVGGHNIPIEEAPYMAAVGFDDGSYCAGAIVHEMFVLTAASCRLYAPKMIVTIGSEDSTSNKTTIEVEKFLCHEDFNNTVKNDICLIKLKEPVQFGKKIGKLDLPEKDFEVKTGTLLNVTGWGKSEAISVLLKRTSIPVITNEKCSNTNDEANSTLICAGAKGRGPCLGDGGAPLTLGNLVLGVAGRAVWNHRAPCGAGADLFTRVTSYVDWIHRTIADNL